MNFNEMNNRLYQIKHLQTYPWVRSQLSYQTINDIRERLEQQIHEQVTWEIHRHAIGHIGQRIFRLYYGRYTNELR